MAAGKTPKPGLAGHTAGIFADMSLDGPEIGTLVAVIDRARNLPNRKKMGKQDPYCAMRLGKEAKKTETDRRGGQTPKWDQELRFTVHDSPDYCKLKCSVFNEDKKNDLIGEVWMNLKDVIVPGGGQNDIWHQLQFKGKYAGEIRVELTYYDTRPKDEAALDQRKEKQKTTANSAGSPAPLGGSRQAGPREVKRRPLLQGPPASSSVSRPPLPEHIHSTPIPALQPSPNHNAQPDSRDIWAPDRYYHSGLEQPISNHEKTYADDHKDQMPVEGGDHAHISPPNFSSIQNTNLSFLDHAGTETMTELSDHGYHSEVNPILSSPVTHTSYHTPSQEGRRHSAQSALPPQGQPPMPLYESSTPTQPSSGMVRSPPGSGDHRHRAQFNHYSTSQMKTDFHRDSPLRQSMSHQECELEQDVRPRSPDEDPPPPPPAHGQRLPSSRPPSNTYQETNAFQVQRKVQASVPASFPNDTRSPLQTLERNFDPYYQPNSSPLSPLEAVQGNSKSHTPDVAYCKPDHGAYAPPPRSQTFPRPSSNSENHPPLSAGSYYGLSTEPDESLNYDVGEDQQLWNSPQSVQPQGQFHHERPNQACNSTDISDSQRTYYSHPHSTRPRAPSPAARTEHPRKPVSQYLSSPLDDRRLSGVPFGPDSYDILNPTTAPTVAAGISPTKVETPEQLKEAARLREVEKLRDQGPIIGNDGREIDPSDHLPSDTWAPEPERKIRKPEVVIRFRTKDETVRTPIKIGSSPTPARPLSMPVHPQSSSPYSVDSPSPGLRAGRNRLQKQMPSRPLPVQPFQHPHSSPAIPVSPPVGEFNTPSPGPRMPLTTDFTTQSSGSRVSVQPTLPGYSVMANRTHRGSPYNNGYDPSPPPIPAKVPFYAAETSPYGPHGNMDPFAVEMSSIDIGGSGGRRSSGRPQRVLEV